MLSVPKLFRSVAHHSHRLSSSIAASTRLFSFTATQKSEKNFAEVEDILKEADASQTAVPERQKPRQSGELQSDFYTTSHEFPTLTLCALLSRGHYPR